MISCSAKHTKYNPIDFRRPKCGTRPPEGLIIDYPDGHEECERLHVNDECLCNNCGYTGYGAQIARALRRQDNVETCPCCKGKGMVPVKDCMEGN
jgi:hypothetical protein